MADTISKMVTKDGRIYDIRDPNAYTKQETDSIIDDRIRGLINFYKVSELPSENIDWHGIYFLVRETNQFDMDVCDEYVYLNGKWEMIGSLDLTEYVKRDELIDYVLRSDIEGKVNEIVQAILEQYPTKDETITKDNLFDNTKADIAVGFDEDDVILVHRNDSIYDTKLKYVFKAMTIDSIDTNDYRPVSSKVFSQFIKSRDYPIRIRESLSGIVGARLIQIENDLPENVTVISCLVTNVTNSMNYSLYPFVYNGKLYVNVYCQKANTYITGDLGTVRLVYIDA